MQAMSGYSWPGNVRELENLIHKMAVVVESGLVEVSDLPETMRFTIEKENGANRSLAEVERAHLETVLASTGGNKTRAAKILRIDRKTLRKKLQSEAT